MEKKEPTKYLVWLICYVGSFIPIAIAVFQLFGPMDDEKFKTMGTCFLVFVALEVIAAVLMFGRKKAWNEFRNEHMNKK